MGWNVKKSRGRIEQSDHYRFLIEIPLFQQVPASSQAFAYFLRKISLVHFRHSQIIYSPGDEQTHVYLVREGEIHILMKAAGRNTRVIASQGRGSLFGEVSYLSGEPHSTTAMAVLDSSVYLIPGKELIRLMEEEPSVGQALSRTLSRRLYSNLHAVPESPTRIFSVVYPENPRRGSLIARRLAGALARENPLPIVLISMNTARLEKHKHGVRITKLMERWQTLRLSDIKKALGSKDEPFDMLDGDAILEEWTSNRKFLDFVATLLGFLKRYYSVIIVDAEMDIHHPIISRFISQSDRCIFIRSLQEYHPGDEANPWNQTIHNYREKNLDQQDQFLTVTDEPYSARLSMSDLQLLDPIIRESSTIYKTHVRLKSESPDSLLEGGDATLNRCVDRLARRINGSSRGISLGGGGARSFAHLGVLQIMEEEGIEFDAVSGASMGAVIGAGYALGMPVKEIIEHLRILLPNARSVLDQQLPFVSFFKGKRINTIIEKVFSGIHFEDTEIPFFCNGTDLKYGKSIVFQRGPLAPALHASVSIPALFPPVPVDDYLIVDGSVLNGVPGDILKKRGFNHIIGVNVTPMVDPLGSEIRLQQREGVIRAVYKYISIPPILRVVTRSISIQGNALMQYELKNMDLVIHPSVEEFDLFDFKKIDAIIEKGREAAIVNMAAIREALSRREADQT